MYKADPDPASTVVATCSFDKHIRLVDFFSGEIIADVAGHSDIVTAVRFSPDGEFLISVGGDGCIFIWKVADVLVQVSPYCVASGVLSDSFPVSANERPIGGNLLHN